MPQSWLQKLLPEITLNDPSIVSLKSELFDQKGVHLSMLRLDQIHENISGNKLFKLIYFLKEAKKLPAKKIITFGGAYSNHLAATAFACDQLNIDSIGIIRGERPKALPHTLGFCEKHGMKLHFISREDFRNINEKFFLQKLEDFYEEHVLISEGGFSIKGKEGAALIQHFFGDKNFSHICLPVGTATTFAGLVDANEKVNNILGFGVLKNMRDIEKRFRELKVNTSKNYTFINDYHFGGYAKKNEELVAFMNRFYEENKIAMDFVYTGKMMYGIYDLIQKNYFARGSNILCIHTGGLQGNDSLRAGTLNY
ncbi:MAG: pyridoxal-phosphate dependent enzyme [Ginsengibacter sp.]